MSVGKGVVSIAITVWMKDALHGVLPTLDARARLRGRCDVPDHLADLLLQLADFLDLSVIDGSDEDQA